MGRNIDEINNQLREYQKEWFEKNCSPWIKNGGAKKCITEEYFERKYGEKEYGFSEPFFTALPNYKDNKPLVMFVGQETNGWGDYNNYFKSKTDNFEALIRESQNYVCQFTQNNLNGCDTQIEYHGKKCSGYSYYAFWNFIRKVYKNMDKQINIIYNNLDKIHYRCKKSNCETLWEKDEKVLNKPLKNNKTLLLNEIKTVHPDMVIFLTGPSYYTSMKSALMIDLHKPTKKILLPNEFSINNIPCYWTYHPNALCRWNKYDDIANEFGDKIKGGLRNV